MKYSNSGVDGVFLLPRKICDHLNVKKSFLMVAIYMFSRPGELCVKTIAEQLSVSQEDVVSAVAYWCDAGVFNCGESINEAQTPVVKTYVTPSYTSSEMADVLADADFSSFYKWVEQKIGKVLNSAEQEKLYGLYDAVGIPYDVLSGIVEYCVSKGKKSLRYIERTVLSIHDEGVRTFEELQSYLEKCERLDNAYEKVKEILGAGSRALSKKERDFVDKWVNKFGSGEELIEYAYELTIDKITKPSMAYMSKILENWYINGYKTIAEIENSDKNTDQNPVNTGKKLSLMDFIEKPQ